MTSDRFRGPWLLFLSAVQHCCKICELQLLVCLLNLNPVGSMRWKNNTTPLSVTQSPHLALRVNNDSVSLVIYCQLHQGVNKRRWCYLHVHSWFHHLPGCCQLQLWCFNCQRWGGVVQSSRHNCSTRQCPLLDLNMREGRSTRCGGLPERALGAEVQDREQ